MKSSSSPSVESDAARAAALVICAETASSGTPSAADIVMPLTCCTPSSFFCTVVNGTITVSSWSCPIAACPLLVSTPMTRNGWLLMRTVAPTGSAPAPNS